MEGETLAGEGKKSNEYVLEGQTGGEERVTNDGGSGDAEKKEMRRKN